MWILIPFCPHCLQRPSPTRVQVAGYVPPTDLSSIPDEIVFQAKRMLYPEANDQLATFLRVCCRWALLNVSLFIHAPVCALMRCPLGTSESRC